VRYSLDTSGLLDGWRYYPPDVFPTLWERITDLIDGGHACASDEVQRELKKKEGDEVFDWCKAQSKLFIPLDDEIQRAVAFVLKRHPNLVAAGGKRSAADPFVIAVARVKKCSVVTGEAASTKLNRPRIPDVCDALGIDCYTFLDVIKREGWSFT
jgi:hypothetical protein